MANKLTRADARAMERNGETYFSIALEAMRLGATIGQALSLIEWEFNIPDDELLDIREQLEDCC